MHEQTKYGRCRSPTWQSQVNWYDENQEGVAEKDLKLHVGGGNVISYRWVVRTSSESKHGATTVLEATKALNASQNAMGLHLPQEKEFLVVVMPDLFMTLNSMERWLGQILEQNPRGRLLLVRKIWYIKELLPR